MHRQLGAKLIDFGGWDMPVSYPAGTIKEHKAVRDRASACSTSRTWARPTSAARARARSSSGSTTNDVESAPVGKAVYTLLCRPDGGVVDDCIFYKRSDDEFMVIFNAGNIAKDLDWFREHANDRVRRRRRLRRDRADRGAGPEGASRWSTASPTATSPRCRASRSRTPTVAGVACIAARTGYTGEDGFELACANADAPALWNALLDAATPLGGLPIGLGARDSLRLESKLPLYGNDLDDDHTPLEAGLGWAVKLDKPRLHRRDALRAQRADGLKRQLVGFKIDDGAARSRATATRSSIARPVRRADDRHRHERRPRHHASAAPSASPTFPSALAAAGTQLTIDCRGKDAPATVVSGKFYKRPK